MYYVCSVEVQAFSYYYMAQKQKYSVEWNNVFFHECYIINVILFLPSIIDISNYSTIDCKIPEYLDIRIDLIVFEARDQGRG